MAKEDINSKESSQGELEGKSQNHHEKKSMLFRRLFMTLLTVFIIVLVFAYILPKFASYSEVFKDLTQLSIIDLVILLVMAIFNLACAWTVNQVALPGLKNRQAAELTLSQNLIASTLPLGGAWSVGLGYEIIHSYGFGAADYSLMLGVSGIWNTYAKLALPVLAVVLMVFTGKVDSSTVTLSIIGLAILIVAVAVLLLILWKRSLAERIGDAAGKAVSWLLRLFHRPPVTTWGEGLGRFRDRTLDVIKRRWLILTFMTILYQISTYWVFLLSLRFSGVPSSGAHGISWITAFAIFAVVRVISAIPITPGAVGIAEASFTGLLVAAGGAKPEVVAGVLMFRGLTWLMPIPLGLPALMWWRVKCHKHEYDNAKKEKAGISKAEDSA